MRTAAAIALLACAGAVAPAAAQLRIATWNISNYSGGRVAEFRTAIYGEFQGRSMAPDILIGQEFQSAASVAAFLGILNSAPGSPGDWAAAAFINGNDTDSAFFYRTSKATLVGVTIVSTGSSSPSGHPRNVQRYDIRLRGYSSAGATLACYSSHMKAGSTSGDQQLRLNEAIVIREDAASLHPEWSFLIGGDFNTQSSNQAAYQQLIGTGGLGEAGRFFDPISTPGSWNNNAAFRFVHTQAPGGTNPAQTGGMDDRFDFLLLSAGLVDGEGFSYIGNPSLPYSTVTWNDPNHSYRAWGNDGTSFDQILRIAGNSMVGPTIAQALHLSTGNDGGHLPVFLDLRVPPKIGSDEEIDFGQVALNEPASRAIGVWNEGDTVLWSGTGIAGLNYSMSATAGFAAPGGSFTAPAGTGGNSHTVTLDTSTPGVVTGTLTIASNDLDQPARIVTLRGEVVAACYANCDGSTMPPVLNVNDFVCFQQRFAAGDSYSNCDGSTVPPVLNVNDFVCFQQGFAAGCP